MISHLRPLRKQVFASPEIAHRYPGCVSTCVSMSGVVLDEVEIYVTIKEFGRASFQNWVSYDVVTRMSAAFADDGTLRIRIHLVCGA